MRPDFATTFRRVSRLRPERVAVSWVGLQPGAADEVDAIGHGGEHRVEAGSDRGRLARQVDDKARAARARDLARQNRGRRPRPGSLSASARRSRAAPGRRWPRSLRASRRAAPGRCRRWSGSAGSARCRRARSARPRSPAARRAEPPLRPPRGEEQFGERGLYAWTSLVLVDAARGPVGYGDDADGNIRQ